MNQRKILHSQEIATPNGEGLTALPVSLNLIRNYAACEKIPEIGGASYARAPYFRAPLLNA